MRLDRVTITGADDRTPASALFTLSERFPFVEWGILLSRSSAGGRRFPSIGWIERLLALDGSASLKLSGHLCGSWVKELCRGRRTFDHEEPSIARGFQRVQLNFHAIAHTVDAPPFVDCLRTWGVGEYIFQLDDVNNAILARAQSAGVQAVPLFDLSGGAGILPSAWPRPSAEYCGYAGGLSPDNLEEQLARIGDAAGESRVWIDVETHVRTPDNAQLDLARVERFLEIAAPHVWTFDDEVRSAK